MDYLENLQFSPKFEPQSARFSKDPYSLHCSVAHCHDAANLYNKYIYHLANDTIHNSHFTYTVAWDLLQPYESQIYQFKSDNCFTQYKSRFVFANWKELSKETKKTVIVYYGVSGHGRGLLDSMGSFGVKEPIKKRIVSRIFFSTMRSRCNPICKKKYMTNITGTTTPLIPRNFIFHTATTRNNLL